VNQDKMKRGEATDESVFEEMEENGELVINNQSTWFRKQHPALRATFGTFGSCGYIICYVIELLRFCRNVITHAGQHPDAMELVLGAREPSQLQLLEHFSKQFSFF
jgi:hypothetical protein